MEQDNIHLYPKTSCDCGDCKKQYTISKGIETNLSVRDCKVSKYFDCYNTVEYGTKLFPKNKNGIYEINPQVYNEKLDPSFHKLICNNNQTCPSETYVSADPRQFNSIRATTMRLDRPPINGNVQLSDINKRKWNGYGQGFTPYKYINDGQIVYYWDKSIEDPFFEPVFSTPAKEQAILYRDPMGSMKPEYNRIPLVNTQNPAVTTANYYPDCLSSIQDSQSHREDLMALQMRRRLQEEWMPRWSMPNEQ